MKKIGILLLTISCIANQLCASDPSQPPVTTSCADPVKEEQNKQIKEEQNKQKLLLTQQETKNAELALEEITKKLSTVKAENKKQELLLQNDLYTLEATLSGMSEAQIKEYKDRAINIKIAEQEKSLKKQNQSYSDYALEVAKEGVKTSVNSMFTSIPNALVSSTVQFGFKVIETRMADSANWRHWVLTEHDLELRTYEKQTKNLQIQSLQLQNKNTESSTALHNQQALNAEFERWIKIQELKDLEFKKRAETMKHIIDMLGLIASQRKDIDKEKGEYEEDKDKAKDPQKKQEFDTAIEECDKDRATLLEQRKLKRKQLIKQIENDTNLMDKPTDDTKLMDKKELKNDLDIPDHFNVYTESSTKKRLA